jgi:hypothetical protein
MTAQNEPLGEPWVIVTVSPKRPVIPLVFNGDAAPKKFSVGASVFTVVVLSLGLWGLTWVAAKLVF